MSDFLRIQPQHDASRQKGVARIVPVLAILFVIALGALAAAPQYQDRDRDHDWDRDHDRGALFVARDGVVRDFGGGRGGRPSRDAMCEPGFVAVGFHVQTGEYFNTAWLDCARVRREGDLGDEVRMTERTGSPGGRPVHDAFCPNGFVLRGLRGRTGASVDEAVGACSPVREIARHFDNVRTEFTQPVTRPYAGGRPAEADCPLGFVVTGFRSNSGEYMDHLWLVCSELRWDRDRDRDHDRDRDRYR
jgi:hypothetical protein